MLANKIVGNDKFHIKSSKTFSCCKWQWHERASVVEKHPNAMHHLWIHWGKLDTNCLKFQEGVLLLNLKCWKPLWIHALTSYSETTAKDCNHATNDEHFTFAVTDSASTIRIDAFDGEMFNSPENFGSATVQIVDWFNQFVDKLPKNETKL